MRDRSADTFLREGRYSDRSEITDFSEGTFKNERGILNYTLRLTQIHK